MRIIFVHPKHTWFDFHVGDTLRRHYDADVVDFDYGQGTGHLGSREWRLRRDKANLRLLNLIASEPAIDLVLLNVLDDFLRVRTARKLKRLSVPIVVFHVDMYSQWYRNLRTVSYYDVFAAAQDHQLDLFRKACNHVIHWPMAANEETLAPESTIPDPYEREIAFVGSRSLVRQQTMDFLDGGGFTVDIWGRGWAGAKTTESRPPYPRLSPYKLFHDLWHYAPARLRVEGLSSLLAAIRAYYHKRIRIPSTYQHHRIHGFADVASLGRLFRTSKINLGFTEYAWATWSDAETGKRQVRLRDFEVPMAGGFYLVQHNPELSRYYKLDKEIVTWNDPLQLAEKVLYFLAHDSEREEIRIAGYRRARANHTWKHRFDQLFEYMYQAGLLAKNYSSLSFGKPARASSGR